MTHQEGVQVRLAWSVEGCPGSASVAPGHWLEKVPSALPPPVVPVVPVVPVLSMVPVVPVVPVLPVVPVVPVLLVVPIVPVVPVLPMCPWCRWCRQGTGFFALIGGLAPGTFAAPEAQPGSPQCPADTCALL